MHLVFSLSICLIAQNSGWEAFEETTFKWLWSDEYQSHIEIPTFNGSVKQLEGKEYTLSGHYIPMELDDHRIIISKQPFASCFFCGGAGPETVAEIVFSSPQRSFKADEMLTVRGKLKLNKWDYDHMVFILENSEIIEP